MPPLKRFPANSITPHGAYMFLKGNVPDVALRSYDDTVVFNVMGGLSIADKYLTPGRFEVKDISGLIPPWRIIDQKGATQDGTTFVDALYEPIEVQIAGRVIGKDPKDAQRVYSCLIDSLDVKREAEFSWFTQALGRWWAPLRWYKTPTDSVQAITNKTQNVGLRLRADNAFWQSYPSVALFQFGYQTAKDDFNVDDVDDLGTGWTVFLSSGGSASGGVHVNNGEVISTMHHRTMIARKVGYTSATNNQVIDITIGTRHDWYYPTDAHDDIWGRMNNTGTPGTDGVRLRVMRNKLQLTRHNSGVETVMRERVLLIPALPGEKFRFIVGEEGNERRFKVQRGGATLMDVKETGTNSPLGATFRGAGIGMKSDNTQMSAGIRNWSVGDNVTITQSGFVDRFNVGDQDMYDNFTVFGPGTFRFWNGPGAGANEYVEFGPLLAGQVMYLRTDPRKRGVTDMTSIPPTPQQLNALQKALKDFLSFATGNNSTPLALEIESWFGVRPPQGNPYSLLNGRWSVPIPPKSPGKAAEKYQVKVSIDNGNADSKIIVAGTPLRRNPY